MAIKKFQGETRWLSNFHECEIAFEYEVYPTTEHAYQASKSLVSAERAAIRACDTPGKARRLGQTVTMRPEWEDRLMGSRHPCKVEMMYRINRQKFFEHEELGDQLLATGNQHLMEGNTWGDKFWGVCDGQGLNWLGRVLMDIREELRLDRKIKKELLEAGKSFDGDVYEEMYGDRVMRGLEKLDEERAAVKLLEAMEDLEEDDG